MHQHAAVDARLWVCECGVDVCVRVRVVRYDMCAERREGKERERERERERTY
jgi:hypothetical protein